MDEMPVNEGQGSVADSQTEVDNNTGAETDVDENDSEVAVGGDDADSGSVDQNDEEVPGAVKGQSAEANKAFAELRKQKEAAEKAAEKAAQKAKIEIQQSRDAEYARRFGDSHGIINEQQYWAAIDRGQKQREEAQRQQQAELPRQLYQDLVTKGYDPKVAESIADGLATKIELQQVKQEVAADKRRQQEAQTKQQQQAQIDKVAKQISADHEALTKKYGEMVPALEDLDEATIEQMKQGVPLKAAWLSVHEDEVIEYAKGNGAKKMAKNVSSKAHLQSEKSGTGSFGKEVNLSSEELSVWKQMFPKMPIGEIKKRVAKYEKQGK